MLLVYHKIYFSQITLLIGCVKCLSEPGFTGLSDLQDKIPYQGFLIRVYVLF